MSNPYGDRPEGESFEDKAKEAYGQAVHGLGGTDAGNLDVPIRGIQVLPAFLRFFKKYATFSGRASRSEFWWWVLADIVIAVVFNLVDGSSNVLTDLWGLAVIVPSLALGARRLHDTGRSGWWQLLALIPIVGAIILIVWTATPPKPAGDKYGPSGITA